MIRSVTSCLARPASGAIAMLLFLLAAGLGPAAAQTPTYSYSGGTGGNNIPWNPNVSTTWQKYQGFYEANLFAGAYAGLITKVYWQHSAASSSATFSNLQIALGQSTATNFSTGAYFTPVTTGFSSASHTIPAGAASSWFSIQLQTPIMYNPAQTLIVQICSSGVTAGTGFDVRDGGSHTIPNVGRIYGGGSGCATPTPSGSTSSYRMNFGFDLTTPYFNDAGISSLVSPVNFCAGNYDIVVNLKNNGANNLTTAKIRWKYDGVQQSDYNWAGTLAPYAETPITLATNQSFAAGVPHLLRAWTELPNGMNDSGAINDTLQATLRPALSGNFTIGGAAPSYATFQAAVNDLAAYGLCGPVVFEVRAGSYPEQVTIPAIPGASAVNTVTFRPPAGSPNTAVSLNFNATTTAMHTLMLAGCDYVTFQNMTIEALGASYAQALVVQGGSDYNTFEGCIIRAPTTTSTSSNLCPIYSPSGSQDNYNTFRNNSILGGGYGVYWYGSSTTALEQGTVWDHNYISGAYYAYKFYSYYQNNAQYLGNTIENTSAYSTAYGMYLYYNMGAFQCVGNKILLQNPAATSTNYGIVTYASGSTNPTGAGPLISNNFIITAPNTTTNYGLYAYYLSEPRIYNNTIVNPSTYTSSCALRAYYSTGMRIKDNILYCTAGAIPYFHYTTGTTTIAQSNYNLLYTTGTYIGYWNNTAVTNTLGAWQAASGMDGASKSKTVIFASTATGDLHLAGASQNDTELTGELLGDVPNDIDGDIRVVPYMGADEACYVLPSQMSYALVDAQGNPKEYAEVPGTVYVQYYLNFPADAVALTVTLRLYDPYTNALVWQTSFNADKLAGQPLSGIAAVSIPSTVPTGAYRIEATFNTKNSCGAYVNFTLTPSAILLVPQGAIPCEVWPGDVNNNGVVNYGDRSALNSYIQNANLRATWIYGPRRYRGDAATNPLTYYTWTAQASSPWATPDGCYMDVDGNGSVNGFDYIGVRINWLKTHGAAPKDAPNALVPETFDMAQNYPNPFNPSTSLMLSVPEASTVQLVVTDMLGREVATLVNGTMQAGVHTVNFDARALPSGQYLATVRMTGTASGLGFSKVVTMTLAR